MIRPRPHGGETAVLALKTHVSSQRTDAMELKNVAGFYTSEVPCHLLVHSACRIKPECLIPQHYFTTLPQTSTLPSTDTTTLLKVYAWPRVPLLPRSGNVRRSGCRDNSMPPDASFYNHHVTFKCSGIHLVSCI